MENVPVNRVDIFSKYKVFSEIVMQSIELAEIYLEDLSIATENRFSEEELIKLTEFVYAELKSGKYIHSILDSSSQLVQYRVVSDLIRCISFIYYFLNLKDKSTFNFYDDEALMMIKYFQNRIDESMRNTINSRNHTHEVDYGFSTRNPIYVNGSFGMKQVFNELNSIFAQNIFFENVETVEGMEDIVKCNVFDEDGYYISKLYFCFNSNVTQPILPQFLQTNIASSKSRNKETNLFSKIVKNKLFKLLISFGLIIAAIIFISDLPETEKEVNYADEPSNCYQFQGTKPWFINQVEYSSGNNKMLIKVYDNKTEELIHVFYMKEQSKCTFNYDAGVYKIKYATGDEWWGIDKLFNTSTTVYEIDQLIQVKVGFKKTLTFTPITDGNLDYKKISRSDFDD